MIRDYVSFYKCFPRYGKIVLLCQYAKKYKRPNRMILSWKTQASSCKGQKAPNELTCPKIALHSNNYKKCTSYD